MALELICKIVSCMQNANRLCYIVTLRVLQAVRDLSESVLVVQIQILSGRGSPYSAIEQHQTISIA